MKTNRRDLLKLLMSLACLPAKLLHCGAKAEKPTLPQIGDPFPAHLVLSSGIMFDERGRAMRMGAALAENALQSMMLWNEFHQNNQWLSTTFHTKRTSGPAIMFNERVVYIWQITEVQIG